MDVSSPGLDRPLKLVRQYHNNIGRDLKVWLEDGTTVRGMLLDVNEDQIVLKIKKGRKKQEEELTISFDQINKALVQRSEEHTSELQSRGHLVCRLLLEKKK